MGAEQIVVDQRFLVELVVGEDRPDKNTWVYRVLRGDAVVASVEKRRADASEFGDFQKGGTLWEATIQPDWGPAWRVRPYLAESPPDRSIFGRSQVAGISLGKRRPPASQRVLELLDTSGVSRARIPTAGGANTGLLETASESYVLSPCKRSRRGELGEVLTILQEGKAMKDRAWELRPTSPATEPVKLGLALLYWHVLGLDYSDGGSSVG